MDFDAVCLSVGQHKCDIAIAGLTVNDERKQYVTFSDTYYQASQRLIVPSDDDTFDDLKDADAVAAKLGELKKKIRSAYSRERQRKAISKETKLSDLKDFRLHASRIRADHLRFRIC